MLTVRPMVNKIARLRVQRFVLQNAFCCFGGSMESPHLPLFISRLWSLGELYPDRQTG